MKNEGVEVKLASQKELHQNTYEFVAKDYFNLKKDGLKASTAKKMVWFFTALVLLSTITPQIVSERHREELAEEIRIKESPSSSSQINIPALQNEDPNQKLNVKPFPGENQRSFPSIKKIESIDLRVTTDPPPGTEVNGILVSGGANGSVKVRTTQDLVLNGEVYASSGSLLIGNGTSTERRLYVQFNRLVSPEGKSKKVSAQAYDFKDHIRGLKGQKVSDQFFKLATSSALIFLSGLSETLQENQSSNIFGSQRKSMRDAALGGVTQATSEQGKRILDQMNNESQIEVQKETELVIIFESKEDKNGQ